MSLPKDIVLLLLNELVVGISKRGFLKGRISCKHDEENDSSCKDIAAFSLVFLCRDLWSHVAFRSKLGLEHSSPISPLQQAREAEIGNLENEQMRQQNILRLDVSMSEAL